MNSLIPFTVIAEATSTKAWVDDGPESVQRKSLERLRTNGWDDVRPALSVTIRGWMMRALITSGFKRDHETAVHFYSNILAVLEWGSKVWRDVSKEDRGSIFDKKSVRAIKCLRAQAMLEVPYLTALIIVLLMYSRQTIGLVHGKQEDSAGGFD